MRAGARLAGRRWPADPRNDYEHRMHVNEQTRGGLSATLRAAGFIRPDVQFGQWVHADFVPSARGQAAYRRLAKMALTKPLAAADLWVNATR
jgi:hypothetical protein